MSCYLKFQVVTNKENSFDAIKQARAHIFETEKEAVEYYHKICANNDGYIALFKLYMFKNGTGNERFCRDKILRLYHDKNEITCDD